MAFVRIKKIKSKAYAYLVENTWKNKRSTQRVIKYLGGVYRPLLTHIEAQTEKTTYIDKIDDLIISTLLSMGFEHVGRHFVYDGCRVDLDSRSITRNGKPVVIKINEGFLCTATWEYLRNLGTDTSGEQLAKAVLESGVSISQDQFIALYESCKSR